MKLRVERSPPLCTRQQTESSQPSQHRMYLQWGICRQDNFRPIATLSPDFNLDLIEC